MTLAHRMIVMNAGRAEQIGTPMDVYENPATLFVAGFIGSPAMNFLPAKADGDGRFTLLAGGHVATALANAQAGRAVTLGIRPEHLRPCGPGEAIVTGPVEMVEQLGADTLIHVGQGTDTVIARVPHEIRFEVGETLPLTADPARIFLFDSATGARLQ
jgi:sn-glycerol 3-phosphate transport system ATP-binding protein